MKIAYLDCFSGMSGDMFLGALVDAGVSPELLEKTVEALQVDAWLEISKVNRSGITATKVAKTVPLDPPNPVSARFHARYGFREVGRQWIGGGKKQVSLQARAIEPARLAHPV